MPVLAPTLNGTQLTVELALKQTQRIKNQISRIADAEMLVGKLYRPLGTQVTGGALVYNVLKSSDFYVKTDVHQRGPGDEYEVVDGAQPDAKVAYIEDWGGVFSITDEAVIRNDISYFDTKVTQLANTIARKVDTNGLAALEAALADGANTIPANSWADLVTVGDPATLTPSAELPTADLSAAALANKIQELGFTADLLIVNPAQAHDLRVAYADRLDAMLTSAGLMMFENARVAQGIGYVVQSGQAGTLGFEKPLTVETWREPRNKTTYVQAYAHMSFAVDKPYAVKKLTGLNT